MKARAFERLVKGEPVNLEDRLENLEKITELKLKQFEDTLLLFRDVVMRLYEEKEDLRKENDSLRSSLGERVADTVKETVKNGVEKMTAPIKSAADDFLEIVAEQEPEEARPLQMPAEAKISHMSADILKPSDEMERTVKWMRERFGLPPHQLAKKKKKMKA